MGRWVVNGGRADRASGCPKGGVAGARRHRQGILLLERDGKARAVAGPESRWLIHTRHARRPASNCARISSMNHSTSLFRCLDIATCSARARRPTLLFRVLTPDRRAASPTPPGVASPFGARQPCRAPLRAFHGATPSVAPPRRRAACLSAYPDRPQPPAPKARPQVASETPTSPRTWGPSHTAQRTHVQARTHAPDLAALPT